MKKKIKQVKNSMLRQDFKEENYKIERNKRFKYKKGEFRSKDFLKEIIRKNKI